MKTRLYSGQIDAPSAPSTTSGVAPATLDRPVRMVYDGTFNSVDGEVTLTPEQIDAFAANHNAKLDRILASGGVLKAVNCPPLQLDHSESATHTVGRLWGKLESKDAEIEGVGVRRVLFGTARFIGPENTQKAGDGRYTNVSVGIDLENLVVDELSIVPFPAAPHAALLSRKAKLSMENEHLKHFLTSTKGMSEDDALRHLGGLDEDGKDKLGAEMKEHLAKMGAEMPEDEDKDSKSLADGETKEEGKLAEDKDEKDKLADGDKDGEKLGKKLADDDTEDDEEKKKKKEEDDKKAKASKMAGGKANAKLAQALKETNAALAAARTELKRSNLRASLSRLRSEGKLTPAEEKNLSGKHFGLKKDKSLAEMSEDTIASVLASFEVREPVIPLGHFGSAKSVDLSSMGGEMKKARLAAQEEETLSNMPFTRQALAATRAAEGTQSAQLSKGEGESTTKIVRLMAADHMTLRDEYDAREAEHTREAKLSESKSETTALAAQITQLSALVTALESTNT